MFCPVLPYLAADLGIRVLAAYHPGARVDEPGYQLESAGRETEGTATCQAAYRRPRPEDVRVQPPIAWNIAPMHRDRFPRTHGWAARTFGSKLTP